MSNSPNNQRKIPASFSSPETLNGVNNDLTQTHSSMINDNSESFTEQISNTCNNITTTLTTSTSTTMIKTFNTGIKLNATRDSGFSDSIIEDSSTSSTTQSSSAKNFRSSTTSSPSHPQLIARSEHLVTLTDSVGLKNTDITLLTKCFTERGALKSVEEDINIRSDSLIQTTGPLDSSVSVSDDKDFITIVKTTKVTTKVNAVDLKKKRLERSTNIQDAEKKLDESNEHDNEEEEEEVVIVEGNMDETFSSQTSQSNETSVFKIDINKSTEEMVFQTSPPKHRSPAENKSATLSSTTNPQDLNSTVLDCEDILSTYSSNNKENGSPEHKPDATPSPHISQPENSDKEPEKISEPKGIKKKSSFKLFSKPIKVEVKIEPSITTKQVKKSPVNLNNNGDIGALVKPVVLPKYKLLDNEQKDRVIYLKPACVNLLLEEFLACETNGQTKTLLSNMTDERTKIVNKMIGRALDLLRHDRIESFERLSARIKEEYNVKDEAYDSKSFDSNTIDNMFAYLFMTKLVNEKILLRLDLDKENMVPYEEIIEFYPSGAPKSRPVSAIFNAMDPQPMMEILNTNKQTQHSESSNAKEPEHEVKIIPPIISGDESTGVINIVNIITEAKHAVPTNELDNPISNEPVSF